MIACLVSFHFISVPHIEKGFPAKSLTLLAFIYNNIRNYLNLKLAEIKHGYKLSLLLFLLLTTAVFDSNVN